MNIFESAIKFLSDNHTVIATVVGIVFTFAKAMSNEKAGPAVAAVQGAVDMVAKLVLGLGNLLQTISAFLADLIKSDGLLGKK